MAKRNKGRKNQTLHRPTKKPRMAREEIAEVKTWLERIQTHAAKAISLSKSMSPADVNESNDLFWALAKYTENVQESIVKLDDINKKVYPALIELDEETWQGLKGMRSRLAHAFWNIDPQILWSTVTTDLTKLLALLSTMIVIEHPVGNDGRLDVVFKTERLLGLPDVTPGSVLEAGHSIVVLVFGHNGRVGIFRVGHEGNKKLVVNSNFDMRFSVYGR